MEEKHQIGRQVFIFEMEDRSKVDLVFSEVGDICNKRLNDVIAEVLSNNSQKDVYTRFDSIDLDLGIINPDILEEELIKKVRAALEKWLDNARQLPTESLGQKGSLLSAFEYYLLHGRMPWWISDQETKPVEQIFSELFKTQSEDTFQVFKKLLPIPEVAERMIHQFSDTFLSQVNQLFWGEKWSRVKAEIADLYRLVEQSDVFHSYQQKQVHKQIQIAFLELSFMGRSDMVSTKDLLASIPEALSKKFKIDSDRLKSELNRQVEDATSLSFEEQVSKWYTATDFQETYSSEISTTGLAAVEYFLRFGRMPWAESPQSTAALEEVLLKHLKQTRFDVKPWLYKLLEMPEVEMRIRYQFSEEVSITIYELLADERFLPAHLSGKITEEKQPLIQEDSDDLEQIRRYLIYGTIPSGQSLSDITTMARKWEDVIRSSLKKDWEFLLDLLKSESLQKAVYDNFSDFYYTSDSKKNIRNLMGGIIRICRSNKAIISGPSFKGDLLRLF